MALLRDYLEIIKPDGQVTFYPLNPAKEQVTIGRHPQNDVVIDNPTVSLFHALFEYGQREHGQGLARFVIVRQDTPPHSYQAGLSHLSTSASPFEIAGYTLVFLAGYHLAAANIIPAIASSVQQEVVFEAVWLEKTRAAVDEAVTLRATVLNPSQQATQVVVDVAGVAESWLMGLPVRLTLAAGQMQTISAGVRAPRWPLSLAGEYHFTVRILAETQQQYLDQRSLSLIIEPFYDFSIGPLLPKQRVVGWSKPAAEFAITLANNGNCPARFYLKGLADAPPCRFTFTPPGEAVSLAGQVELTLAPEQTVAVPVQVTALERRLVGTGRVNHHFTISGSVLQSSQLPRAILGQLSGKPLFGPGLVTLLAIALFAFGWLLLQPWLNAVDDTADRQLTVAIVSAVDEAAIFPFTRPNPAPSNTLAAPVFVAPAETLTYEAMFQEIAPLYQLDWRVLEALAYRESGMNYLAVGRASDMGLMQIIPSTWGQWAPKVNAADPFDPYSNILVGAAYLAYVREFCLSRGYTDWRWALVAYNWGPNRLGRFWDDGGIWEDVPATQRHYASGIVDASTQRAATIASFEEFYPGVATRP